MKECARNIHGEHRLGDPRLIALLGKQVKILDAAIKDIDRMYHSQMADIRHFHLDRTTRKVFGGETDDSRQEIHLLA